jgi:hypothetical protein
VKIILASILLAQTVSPISGLTVCELVRKAISLGATYEEIEAVLKGHSEGLECLRREYIET